MASILYANEAWKTVRWYRYYTKHQCKKSFKSRYVDDKGAWTYTSVDDGYVDFADYIKDRRDGVDNGISFNGKQFRRMAFYKML